MFRIFNSFSVTLSKKKKKHKITTDVLVRSPFALYFVPHPCTIKTLQHHIYTNNSVWQSNNKMPLLIKYILEWKIKQFSRNTCLHSFFMRKWGEENTFITFIPVADVNNSLTCALFLSHFQLLFLLITSTYFFHVIFIQTSLVVMCRREKVIN